MYVSRTNINYAVVHDAAAYRSDDVIAGARAMSKQGGTLEGDGMNSFGALPASRDKKKAPTNGILIELQCCCVGV